MVEFIIQKLIIHTVTQASLTVKNIFTVSEYV